jgi:hypothetical protein
MVRGRFVKVPDSQGRVRREEGSTEGPRKVGGTSLGASPQRVQEGPRVVSAECPQRVRKGSVNRTVALDVRSQKLQRIKYFAHAMVRQTVRSLNCL